MISTATPLAAGADRPLLVVDVDTHADVHVAALVDQLGRLLDTISIPTTPAGYQQLVTWAGGHLTSTVSGLAAGCERQG